MNLVALVVQSVRSWSKVATMAIQLTVVALCTNLRGDSSHFSAYVFQVALVWIVKSKGGVVIYPSM